ncbi:hypothetical protein FFA43_01220 [Campylobacter hyointestinalis subsp. hyointestinalis]|uniref:XRE family transcriptional regulator n=1 Tax=Campylobacter hyointestinalis TaxID=198 RepID=UPI00072883A1|nr:XRE family transcriptional regulator [Campylobacter hyointestinalis]PPB57607.1 hypothetical protein CDQ71_06955 [Campylobacter hyointestinalis subsp. hyointestinalis]QCT99335.1 hypothetical protein FFA43_01220 [Campylobacter hyointestinalis subsp. hyointestinalis]CUU82009.1 transcriptional regulator [Campylobacter hyointestinalis subsp. hyointestinalis]
MNAGSRLKKIREYLEISSQAKFAAELEIERSKIADIESGRTKNISFDLIEKIVDKFHINGWWLFTGKGNMIEKNIQESDVYEVDVIDLKASAGFGIIPFEIKVIGKYILDKIFFKTPPDIDNVKMIQVEGDSMEPTIQDGAFVVIDESKNDAIDGIYAILIDDKVFVKRLQFNLDGTITIISDNGKYQDKIYNPKENQSYFKVLGKKMLTIQK